MQKNKIQWYSKLPPESQNHCNVIYTLKITEVCWLSHPVADSPASLIAECVGEWMWVCESMLQDSGTPSLPSPLSVSVWVPESLLAWIEQPLGPKEQWTRPLRKKTVGASQCGLGWSPKVVLTSKWARIKGGDYLQVMVERWKAAFIMWCVRQIFLLRWEKKTYSFLFNFFL